MASCADCVHVDVCEDLTRYKLSPKRAEELLSLLREKGKTCKHFQDRSRFVELPCKVGDFVYFIKARRVMADIVSKFTIDRCGVMLQRVNGYNLGYTDKLGKKIFLTHEEAEQALKERENDE